MSVRSRPLAAAAALLAAALVALLPALPAAAASGDTGWVRVAHLSPDTKQVDVTLSSLSGGTTLYKLSSVGYGAVSQYIKLPPGTYAIAMVPAGAPAGSTPVVKASVTVDAGKASTVAALGLNKDLQTHVYADDLTAPASGKSRVRVLQASTKHDTVTVKVGSQAVASDLSFAAASPYTDVSAGSQPVTLTGGGASKTSTVSLPAGSVHTLFVLDNASGGLTVSPILESSAAAVTPTGAIDTGAGGLAGAGATPALAGGLAALAGVGGLAAGGVLLRRRTASPQH
ncbi:MAG TPA: DUF4397 domain-containing protein [Amnibacterium sp.]|jgi:hypothetical protein|uniref:DUF4397 domain-containing protein n=1 Tax=Amnibacterium sp. TaxID=1872496 RepID=UPI002F944BEC